MIVTGAFFTDHAEDDGSKLSVTGGVWDYVNIPAGIEGIGARLVVLVQASPDDYDHENVISVDATAPDGESAGRTEVKIVELGNRAENRYFHFNVPFRVPQSGRYAFRIEANGEHPLVLGLDIRSTADE